MWGISNRGARLSDRRRRGRVFEVGLARVSVRGPFEHAIVELSGELDFTAARELVGLISALEHNIVAIDMTALEFVDTQGVHALRALSGVLAERNGGAPAEIIGMRPAVRRTFSLVEQRLPTLV